MKNSTVILAVFALVAAMQTAQAGDVTGKVTLKGTHPPETPIDFSSHAECGDIANVKTSRRYEVGKDNGLKDVFVYVSKGFEGQTFPVPKEPVFLDQSNCTYQTHVFGVMVGQTIQVKNSDTWTHNVHAVPQVDGNQEYNIMQTDQGAVNTMTFAKPEVLVEIQCNVHEWMLAYAGVVSNPYYAVTDADGNFKIANLPPGAYTLTAYHLKAHGTTPGLTQEIKVTGGDPVTANFTVEVPK